MNGCDYFAGPGHCGMCLEHTSNPEMSRSEAIGFADEVLKNHSVPVDGDVLLCFFRRALSELKPSQVSGPVKQEYK